MTRDEVIALASAIIATLSLLFNVIQAFTIYRLNRRNAARGVVIEALRELLTWLEHSQLFVVNPHHEIWEYGFQSLQELGELCAAAHVAVQMSEQVDVSVRESVSELHDHVKGLRGLRDSYSTFAHTRRAAPANLQQEWPDWERAKSALMAARPAAEKCKRVVTGFLRKQ